MYTTTLSFVFVIFLLFACQQETTKEATVQLTSSTSTTTELVVQKTYEEFDRSTCIQNVKDKIKNGEALVVYLKVPLCDNENQGIIPVPKKLGDGLDLRNNLYWGAKYGIKTYFKQATEWSLLDTQKDIDENILERLIFYREFSNGAKVYLVAEAYRGDRMKKCLQDFLAISAGKQKTTITVSGVELGINGHADLLVFNGHNGLMEYELDYVEQEDDRIREAVVIACASHDYFKTHFKHAKAYPLLTTTNLMAPEAYVVHAVINAWAKQLDAKQIRVAAGKAYHQYQKCGIKGATRLFKTAW